MCTFRPSVAKYLQNYFYWKIIGEKKRKAFLDLLIESSENGVVLSDLEVREQVDTIMFEVCSCTDKILKLIDGHLQKRVQCPLVYFLF